MYPLSFMRYLEANYRDLYTLYIMKFCQEDQLDTIAEIYVEWSAE